MGLGDDMNKRNGILLLAVASVALAGGCASDKGPETFDPRNLGDAQRNAAVGLASAAPVALPEKLNDKLFKEETREGLKESYRDPMLSPITSDARVVSLELRKALQQLVVSNSDVRVAAFQPGIDGARVTEAESRFDPVVQGELTFGRDTGINTNSFFGITPQQNTTAQGRIGIQQNLESGGQITGSWSLNFTNIGETAQSDENTQRSISEFTLELTQPLLRDFGRDVNRARIVINRNNQHISILEFRNTLEEQLQRLEQAYWQLSQAQREVEIQQELLQKTIDTAIILSLRQKQDVTRVQLSQANASIEQRRAQLVRARANVADQSDTIKRLMNDMNLPVAGGDLILPATPPATTQVIYDRQAVIGEALRYRPELGQQQLRVQSAMVASNVARNNSLPRLDLVLRGTVQGFSSSGVFESAANAWDKNGFWEGNASVGIQFEYPLQNRAAKSIELRANLQQQQALTQYNGLMNQVSAETSTALRDVETSYTEIARTRDARFASADALQALQVREDNNEPLTPQFVDQKLRAQELLAEAQRQEAAAISRYNIAVMNLERAKGTLLRYNNIVIQEESMPQ
jgi:outer membrane protein